MWRLKVADGGDDPNIYRTNNFVVRQTWEFDPDYGTPEERAEWKKPAKITGRISFRSGPAVIFSGECRKSHLCQNMQEQIEK